jgi:hypothetical protein
MGGSFTAEKVTDSLEGTTLAESSDRPRPTGRRGLPLVTLLVLTTAAWLPLFLLRIRTHQANVDDNFYALLSNQIANGSVNFLHTGQTSPLVPTLAAPLVANFGISGGVFLQLPLLLLTVIGAYLLVRTWIRPVPAALTALAIGINQAVIGYAIMIHFSIAVTGAVVWIFYCYLRSDHLREPRWCVGVGVAFAALLLSRSMTPSYAFPLLLVLIIDLGLDLRRRRPRWTRFLPVVVVLLLAGPWWLVSGHTALHYLFTAGYNNASGFSSQTAGLSPSSIYHHINWFLEALAWPQSIALGAAALVSLWGVARYRRALNYRSIWLVVAWILLTVLVLSSTGDNGSGFGLPVIAMTFLVCGSILGQLPALTIKRQWGAIAGIVLIAVLLVGVFAEGTGGTSFWWNGPPYRNEVLGAGGSWGTNLDAISSEVSHIIGSEPTLEGFGDALLNGNSLDWTTRHGGLDLIVPPNSGDSTKVAIASLARAKFVISGSSFSQYPPPVDEGSLELAAEARNFVPARTWTFTTSPGRTTAIIVWKRNPTSAPSRLLRPDAKVLKPSPGVVLSGHQFLVAQIAASDRIPVPVTKVEFLVSGEGFHDAPVGPGGKFAYGYIGAWNTTLFPNGRYVVICRAVSAGRLVYSRGVAVQVKN